LLELRPLVVLSLLAMAAGCGGGSGESAAPAAAAPTDQVEGDATWRHTETVHLVSHRGRLFAGMGQWMLPGQGHGTVLVKDSAAARWQTVAVYEGLRVTALGSVDIPATHNRGVPQSVLLSAGALSGRSRIQLLVGGASEFVDSFVFDGAGHEVRSFAGRVEGDEYAFYAGVSPDGILRGTWRPDSRTISWTPAPEVRSLDAKRFMSMTECGGALYASSAHRLYRRNDGTLPPGVPRWLVFAEGPPASERENSGLRALTCLDRDERQSLLMAAEGTGLILRLDELPVGVAASFAPPPLVTELDVRQRLRQELQSMYGITVPATGFGSIAYTIAAYNEFLKLQTDRGQAQLFGVEWGYAGGSSARPSCPAGRGCAERMANGYEWDNAACIFARSEEAGGPAFSFGCLEGPAFATTPGTRSPVRHGDAFVAARTIRPSPFAAGSLFVGGYDCNYVPADGTAWIAEVSLQLIPHH
jgi:hypothetical protein